MKTVQCPIKIKINPSNKKNIKINGGSPSATIVAKAQNKSTIGVSTVIANYDKLTHKPSINGHILSGNMTSKELGIEEDKSFVYRQTGTPSKEWIIYHNLNKYPSVTVIDSAGNEIVGDVRYDNTNQVTVFFTSEFKGTATLN